MIRAFQGILPQVSEACFIAESAEVIGDVVIGSESSVWFHSVVRGDIHQIRIGCRTNIQDLSILHVRKNEFPVFLGDDITIGHRAIIHGCTIRDRVMVGMGAIILDGVVIGENSVIGAGALLTPGTAVPPGSLVLGSPAKVARQVTKAEIDWVCRSAQNYVEYARRYRAELKAGASGGL
ncbi:MAG TPA: gamma carbonic anhydrase family protein [Acidobacteriota bacterium]|nr:gamma carbonic anhydrase family protein [Acidobacteriota bacterium]